LLKHQADQRPTTKTQSAVCSTLEILVEVRFGGVYPA
jgi:hypothetical protein